MSCCSRSAALALYCNRLYHSFPHFVLFCTARPLFAVLAVKIWLIRPRICIILRHQRYTLGHF